MAQNYVNPAKIKNFESPIANINWHNVNVTFPDGNTKTRPLRVAKSAKPTANMKLFVTVSGQVYPVKVTGHNAVTVDMAKAVSTETVPATHKALGIVRKDAAKTDTKASKKPAAKKASTKPAASKKQNTEADAIATLADQLGVDAQALQATLALLKS